MIRSGDNGQLVVDLCDKNVNMLGGLIKQCLEVNRDIQLYSSLALKHPGISFTRIPGLKDLFIDACINHGLIGYLKYQIELDNGGLKPWYKIIMNNIAIITCGTVDGDERSHIINEDELDRLRQLSIDKFNDLRNS